MTTTVDHPTPSSVQDRFRDAMASVAAAVSVVTTVIDGVPRGSTVSAFVSVSMDPPMLLVSLMHTSRLLSTLEVGAVLGVNVLGAHQGEVAQRFARRRADPFADLAWALTDGAPALAERHAWVAVRVARLVPAGDHVLVLGDVLAADSTDHPPLTYWRRTFGTHLPHETYPAHQP